ncbi:aminoacyl-tRNA hydrolase [Myxococcota bacterium]|nr:aminoacyl-tRNA hydrolase [Myxococcota bacterium]
MTFQGFLIAGLGNPGPEYARTRHNLGARALFLCAQKWCAPPFRKRFEGEYVQTVVDGCDVALLFPHTYMNISGRSIAAAMRHLGVDRDRLIVLHDDVDLAFGRLRVKLGGGNGGHNGLKSISGTVGGPEYARVRLGVGRPPGDMVEYVLSAFTADERPVIPDMLENCVNIVETILKKDVTYAMNAFNGQS